MDPAACRFHHPHELSAFEVPPPYNSPSVPLEPPPDYEAAVAGSDAASQSSQYALFTRQAITLSIEGRHVYSSLSKPKPIYSLTHELDGHELSLNGILLTRIDRQSSAGEDDQPVRKRDVFALRDAPQLHLGPAKYEIDGLRCLSGKKGYMNKTCTRSGQGWSAGGCGLPSFGLRPTSNPGVDAAMYEWRDKSSDHIIAIETRRRWDKKNKIEVSPPTMELKIGANVDKSYLDFLVASWCIHNWREAKELTKEPLTWEECQYLPIVIVGGRNRGANMFLGNSQRPGQGHRL
ncbi:hypothetical protein LOZ61_005358 [Ophidiomyces ophidiicola]|nr:hypothetical protein LOZ61_005358 [Ophidiomyces ophidiicola]KAI1922337.1 hypothetical protein LOZ60_005767 [Ophidiomyces ophidiicola]KAI1968834.1 hypothetical protein LOZ56_004770 [Ophidiomyces ophidiicola]KAI2007954.1 hypothetical protein LOZ49_004443 [Ophidiomyces ophidiicola]KAI2028442.1 hypothetical protein LOZ45_002257 [Ophidiomyces ophidiicola]